MLKNIVCDECKKIIGTIDDDALVIDSEFGLIGIEKYCGECKKLEDVRFHAFGTDEPREDVNVLLEGE